MPTEDEILEAIRTSGYLMEQEVASMLEAAGLHVQTNRAFKDLEEEKSREIDISAISELYRDEASKLGVFLELLCECKNTTNPFVFLQRPRTTADDHRAFEELILPRHSYTVPIEGKPNSLLSVPAVDHLGIRKLHFRSQEALKAVQFAKIVREKGAWSANHAGLYDAIFYPLVKALLARQAEVQSVRGDWQYIWMFFPILVTSGELYVLDTSVDPPALAKTSHVNFVRHIRGSKIDGYFAVDFVTRESVLDFYKEKVRPYAEAVAELVRANPTEFRKPERFGA